MPEPRDFAPNITHPGVLLNFLAWVAERPRTYADVMEAWRTSCPRLSAWEDAVQARLVYVQAGVERRHGEAAVVLSETGAAYLASARVGSNGE